ncbi:hypothetical protein PS623_04352 [Pseudomonas fluorescens]|uniref:hypothetical protein n=1 Tax=Pseudomonas fluorescens TaxID=294 RepID=UPI001250FE73|nr:hypothetical protein [Pseudomonas fluorescens]VVN22278.1 hypothetical protein PS623_04352 [Pseudomonas fluorescens]
MKHHHVIAKQDQKLAKAAIGIAALFSTQLALAAGGLDAATSEMNEIKTWAYGFLGVVALCYLLYNVFMAMIDRKSWGDVTMALGYVAIAGAVIVLGEWAWAIWGS